MQSAMLVVKVVTEGHGRRSGESRHRGHMSAGPVTAPLLLKQKQLSWRLYDVADVKQDRPVMRLLLNHSASFRERLTDD